MPRETMEIVREELGLTRSCYETDDRLKEISFGDWESFTIDELRSSDPAGVAAREADKFNFIPPNGESYAQLLQRVEGWLPSATSDAVVVCHGGILRVLERLLNGTPANEAAHQLIPQDRLYKWDGDKAVWL